jgi:hypothetical protein
MEGAMIPLKFGEVLEGLDSRIECRQRLYAVDELREVYGSAGMTFERVFHGNGRPKEPTDAQFELSCPLERLGGALEADMAIP